MYVFLGAITEDLHFILLHLIFYHCLWCILGSGGAEASLLSRGGWLRCNLDELSIYRSLTDTSNCSHSPATRLVLFYYYMSAVFGLCEKTAVAGWNIHREKKKKHNPSFYLPQQQQNFQLYEHNNKSIRNVRGKNAPIHKVISPKNQCSFLQLLNMDPPPFLS